MKLPGTMRGLQLRGCRQLTEVSLPVPNPKEDEVLVQTIATTICTSDINDVEHNPFGISMPRVLGHEAAGVVVSYGSKVKGYRSGDKVAVHPVIPCGTCPACLRKLEHLCTHMGHLGIDRDGTFAEYFCVRHDRIRRVPNNLEMATAALLEPVSVSLQAVERARLKPGENLLIAGDGPFGILIGRLALRHNPGKIFLVGGYDFRLQQLPQAYPIRHDKSNGLDPLSRIRQLTNGNGVDAAILATDSQDAINLCIASLCARGRMVVFSAPSRSSTVDLFKVHTNEIEILGCCNDDNLLDAALLSMPEPDLQLASLITHRLPFGQWPLAFELAKQRKECSLKVALMFEKKYEDHGC